MTDPTPLPPPADPWSDTDPAPYTAALGRPVDHTLIDPRAAPGGPRIIYVEAPRRRRWPWVLGTLAVIGGLCCGVGAAVTAPIWRQYPATVSVGETVAGLNRVRTPEVEQQANELVRKVRGEQGVEEAFAAVLVEPDDATRKVIIFGATLFILDPAGVLEAEIKRANDEVAAITRYDSGAMGGEIRCGEGRDDRREPVVICAWIDHGSIALGIFYGGRTQAESAQLFTAIRAEVLRRG